MEETYLFHFTRERAALYGILKDTFKPSYAREHFHSLLANYDNEAYVPVVSFSEMKKSDLENCGFPYGNYGLCMMKEWAQSKHLCPVLYMDINSECLGSFIQGIQQSFHNWQESEIPDDKMIEAHNNVMNILRYTKPYRDDLVRESGTVKNYWFAKEQEWRYAVPMDKCNDMAFISKEEFKKKKKAEWNKMIETQTLGFEVADIEYVIVPADLDVQPLIDYVTKLGKYSEEEIGELKGKIKTVTQLSNRKESICGRVKHWIKNKCIK